jgi:hypothetical protein
MYALYKVGSAPLIMCMSGRGGMKSFPTRNPIRTYKLKTTNNYICHKYKTGIFSNAFFAILHASLALLTICCRYKSYVSKLTA